MSIFRPKFDPGGWQDLTITLASLASSSTITVGRESTVIDNTSNLFEDFLIGGRIRVGTSPTSRTSIEGWIYTNVHDLTTYPDTITGADAGATITSGAIKRSALHPAFSLELDSATSDRDYWIAPFSLLQALGFTPQKWGLFVVHNTGVALNATGTNHKLSYIGMNGESI